MTIAVYRIDTGRLVSLGTVAASNEELAARNLAAKEVGVVEQWYQWNETLRDFDRPVKPADRPPSKDIDDVMAELAKMRAVLAAIRTKLGA